MKLRNDSLMYAIFNYDSKGKTFFNYNIKVNYCFFNQMYYFLF